MMDMREAILTTGCFSPASVRAAWWSSVRPPMPSTALADAFLRALLRFAARRSRETGDLIALPSGRVDPLELAQVIVALKCARLA
jgi:hypothetical protein